MIVGIILSRLHVLVDGSLFQIQYWPFVSVAMLMIMMIFLSGAWRRLVWGCVFVVVDIFFILVLLPQVNENIKLFSNLAANWAYFGLTWFIGCAIALFILALLWLVAVVLAVGMRCINYNKIVNNVSFYVVLLFSMLSTFVLVLLGCGHYDVVYDNLILEKWHADKKVRIAFFSDAHLGFDDNVQKLHEICDDIIVNKCDVALFGGDFLDDEEMRSEAVAQLSNLAQKLSGGVFFVSGNGDYSDGNWQKTKNSLLDNGIKVLDNTVVNIGNRQHPLLLAGVEYGSKNNKDAYDAKLQKKYLQQTATQLPKDVPKILLAHTPDIIPSALPYGFELMLFGHTHGGQIDLGFYRFMSNQYKYISGTYRQDNSRIIVSNGIGQWFPARINVPQRLHIIDIHPAN